MSRRELIRVDVCCNDPDNGLFAGRAEMVQVGDVELLELEALSRRAPRFAEVTGGFRLAGKIWPVVSSKDWFGNWCWNAYWLDLSIAVDFTVWLHSRKLFDVQQAEARLFNLWRLEKPLDRPFVDRLLHKQFASELRAQR